MGTIVDAFLITFDTHVYPLVAYGLKGGKAASEQAGRLAFRVRKSLGIPCAWAWQGFRLVAASELTADRLQKLLEDLWANKELQGFEQITGVYPDPNWIPTASAIADFVVRGVLNNDADQVVRASLDGDAVRGRKLAIEKAASWRGIVVGGQPAVQVHIDSNLVSQQTLAQFYEERCSSPDELFGLQVSYGTMKGTVETFEGTLGEHRARLLKITEDEKLQKLMQSAPDSDLVLGVRVMPNKPPYHYAISALGIIVTMGDLNAMGINPSEVQKHLRLSPAERNGYTTRISQVLQRFTQGSPGVKIGIAFNSDSHPHLFLDADQIGFNTSLRFGRNVVTQINSDGEILQALKKNGIYRLGEEFIRDNTLRIAVLDALPESEGKEALYHGLHVKLKQTLRPIGLVPPANLKYKKLSLDQNPTELRAQLDRLLKELIAGNPHIILVYLPKTDRQADDDSSSLYHRAKSICVREGVASQVVYEDTLSKGYATANIVMGILGKTGNIPFVLGDPINYADIVVGLDVSRRMKTRAAGTTSIAAMSRIYLNTGEFIGYSFSSAPIEGETIPTHVLETILPESEFGGKRVIIHRDGNFRGDELKNLTDWGTSIGAVFLPMEVTKSGAARLYGAVDESVYQAEKGSAFVIDERTAYLVSSPPPFDNATAMPLTIKNFSDLSIQQALHSVLALTLLHYGSVRPPKLPVSTHFSDEIAGLLTRGIYPLQEKGKKPYWL